ncbi:hypothetical protein SORBI_3006G246600 [Sorghum bicolor]|uniref:Uncharacterized protein n=1 Tax=Sorghum bicolor TaxID=4558 RepID=C5Y9H6_SORBI|nr:hypothetical protein SORBI_3006G246600 [Sorghum bicolor]
MASQAIESHRAGAEVVTGGDAICRKKSIELLEELGPARQSVKIKQTVSYAAEVTAFAEKGKLRQITGVKTKELMLWLSVVEVYVPEASPEKVTFKTGTGLSDTFNASAFALGG